MYYKNDNRIRTYFDHRELQDSTGIIVAKPPDSIIGILIKKTAICEINLNFFIIQIQIRIQLSKSGIPRKLIRAGRQVLRIWICIPLFFDADPDPAVRFDVDTDFTPQQSDANLDNWSTDPPRLHFAPPRLRLSTLI